MSEPDFKCDFVDVIEKLVSFIQNLRVAAYNEGYDAGKREAALTPEKKD